MTATRSAKAYHPLNRLIPNGDKLGPMIFLALLWLFQTPQPSPLPPQTYPVLASADDSGYEQIFDGKTLTGWEGDPKYWRVEGGALLGEVTPETLLKQNSFLIWRGG